MVDNGDIDQAKGNINRICDKEVWKLATRIKL